MGRFYENVTVLDVALPAVREVCPGPAFAIAEGPDVVVYARGDDEGPLSAADLSTALGCVAVSVGVHDDDILFFEVHDRGRAVLGGAVPDPNEYFGIDPEMLADLDPSMMDELGAVAPGPVPDGAALVAALGRGDAAATDAVLGGDFVFATERHGAFVAALGLPGAAVGWGFRYLERDDVDGHPDVERLDP